MTVSAELPQLEPGPVTLTDGGLETDLIFHHGIELPMFAAFPLLDDPEGRAVLADYYRRAARTALDAGDRFSLDTVTWRAGPEWATQLGYDESGFERINRDAVAFARTIADEFAGEPIVLCGMIGPRGDGYVPGERMSGDDAREFHRRQAALLAEGVDYLAALTLSYPEEAIGIALAARDLGIPVALSFTVETDGRLPSGDGLLDAIAAVDAATGGSVAYLGINCAHPDHLPDDLDGARPEAQRIRTYRANASRQSHTELDEAEELDDGDPAELARLIADLRTRMPQLAVLGGCCGTDDRHLRALATALA